MTRLAEAFEKSPHGPFCQRLESFSLSNHGSFTLKDFRRVMESLPALKDLELSGYVTHLLGCIPSYMTTLSKLRRLSIAGCCWATPSVVQEFLCSMPNLEVFEAHTLSDIAILEDPRPWVCTGLRELTLLPIMHFDVPFPVDGNAETMMLDRLCQLEGLQTLRFLTVTRVVPPHPGMEIAPFRLRMERGLDKLKTLRQMQSFQVPRGQLWSEAEARWALKNWTQLQEIVIEMDSKAKELLSHIPMRTSIEDHYKILRTQD